MPGYRITLKPEWQTHVPPNTLIVERDITRPLKPPHTGERLEDAVPVCSKCRVQHFHKTYHLQLRAGTVIVSETIWQNLQQMTPQRWELVNVVEDPPAQTIEPGKEPQLVEKVPQPITRTLLGNGYDARN